MSDWDASEDEEEAPTKVNVPAVARGKKWEDEDLDDGDVKDSWSASEGEDDQKVTPAASGSAPPLRQKGITKQKIAEKEAAERARTDARAHQAALDADPVERKRREQAQQLKSDMENVAGLFGSTTVSGSDDLLASDPTSRTDFEEYAARLADFLQTKHGSKAFYPHFIDQLAHRLCEPLRDLDVRKASSTLATLANEKQKAQREATGGKKKTKKPGLGILKAGGTGGSYDTRAYDEALDDFGAVDGRGAAGGGAGGGRYDDDDFM